ncbi:serine-enriched protein-like [Mizuhopecten yessoensis]|uniref:serine-enriched protein-like n=1 Tax=Mizuhopecten yessoensis TaxID=6573 RepID=UPI000B45DB1A|nr:serine-enriched protein-like [Mizuhopecten yessoensis]
MERTDSTAKLVDSDHLGLLSDQPESEGFSSGYDSADTSDSESSPPHDNDDNKDVDDGMGLECDNISSDHVKYQNTSALCEHLKYILSMPELCDVTFLVGPTKVPVHGVKAILSTRSRVMYQFILKNERCMKEAKKSRKPRQSRLTIEVNKYQPEDFRKIVQFIHCGSVDVDSRSVAGLLCGARQFGLDDLKTACLDYIRRCVQTRPQSLITIQRGANQYIHHRYGIKLFTKMQHFMTSTTKKVTSTTKKVAIETAV